MARAGLAPEIPPSRIPIEAAMSEAQLDDVQARLDVMAPALAALAR
jgi:hypothetical protein